MMDVLSKIRQLLGDDKSRKRKANEENPPSLSGISKKYRLSSQKLQDFHNDYPDVSPINNFETKGRHSGYSFAPQFKFDKLFLRKENSSTHPDLTNYHFHNGISNNYVDDDGIRRNYIPASREPTIVRPRPSIKKTSVYREVPALLRTNLFPLNHSRVTDSSGISHSQNLQHNVQTRFPNIPELYRVKKINNNNQSTFYHVNGQSHQNHQNHQYYPNNQNHQYYPNQYNHNEFGFNDLSSANSYFMNNPLSLKQCVKADSMDNNVASRKDLKNDDEKSSYSRLLGLIPFYNKSKAKTGETANKLPKPQDIIDLVNDNDNTKASTISSRSSTSVIEPVNSLRDRLQTKPVFKDEWLTELNSQYAGLHLNRSELKKAEKEKTTAAEKETQKRERTFTELTKKLSIADGAVVFDLAEEEEEVVNDFPPLSDEQIQKLIEFISGRDTRTVLIEKFSLSITKHDIQTLSWSPLTWLNDEVINFYMELLAERSKLDDNLPKVYCMNTFFLKRLLEVGYSGVRRWTRKVDIFSYDIIPIPVHKGIHWCMSIINFKEKTIKYYDSMGAPNNSVLKALEDYLQSESLDKKNTQFDMSDWRKENVQNIPQQENGSDCGVFSCMYAEFLTRERPILFTQQHMQYFRMRMVYEICTGKLLV